MRREIKSVFCAITIMATAIIPLSGQNPGGVIVDGNRKTDIIEPVVTPQVPVKAAKAVGNQASSSTAAAKKANKEVAPRVVFAPTNNRDPFLSMEEVDSIEKARLAEQKRIAEERRRMEELERQRRAELERQRRLEEELKRNPARAIIDKITIDGILGTEAIVNGEIVGVNGTVLGAKVVKVSDDSVTFVYKGQRFVKKLPLM